MAARRHLPHLRSLRLTSGRRNDLMFRWGRRLDTHLSQHGFGSLSIEPPVPLEGVETSRVWHSVLPKPLLRAVSAEADAYHRNVMQHESELPIGSQVTRWLEPDASPRFAIEAAIQTLQRLVVPPGNSPSGPAFAGAEWWVQRRPMDRSLDFHFDADSCLLHTDCRLRCPSASSVFYLTDTGGPTVVLDQKVADGLLWGSCLAPETATRCDLLFPKRNQYAVFPGRLLHGVLPDLAKKPAPCSRSETSPAETDELRNSQQDVRTTLLVNWWFGSGPAAPCCSPVDDDLATAIRKHGAADISRGFRESTCGDAAVSLPQEKRLEEFDVTNSSLPWVEVDSEMHLVGAGGLVPISFLIPDPSSPAWQERVNTAVTGMDHARRIRTAYDA